MYQVTKLIALFILSAYLAQQTAESLGLVLGLAAWPVIGLVLLVAAGVVESACKGATTSGLLG